MITRLNPGANAAPEPSIDPAPTHRWGPRRRAPRPRADLPDYTPARMVNEFNYCPRLFFLEWVDGLFAHSFDTVEGTLRHEKLGNKPDPLPPPDAQPEKIHSRSVHLSSETYKLTAIIDLVEGDGDTVIAVDYKKGAPRATPEGPEAWPSDRVQVAVQGLILRDQGYLCDEAVLYYAKTKQRVRVVLDDALIAETLATVAAARATAAAGRIPPPLVDSPKCPRCSLVSICLPDETTALHTLDEPPRPSRQLELFDDSIDEIETWPTLDQAADLREAAESPELRRLVPARDDLRPLYVTGNGLSIGRSSAVLKIKERGTPIQDVRIGEISQINVFGNNQLTAAAIQTLCQEEKPIAHFSFGGWFYGMTQGLGLKNVFLRREQFRRADDATFCLWLARRFVAAKIRNQRTLLKRNHLEPPRSSLIALARFARTAEKAADLQELLGIEGSAARTYFGDFPGMIKVDPGPHSNGFDFDLQNRNRRPPRDPVNALLSFAYSMLAKDLTIVLHSIGFDPFLGFFHQPRFGRPAFALDLMEEFRPLIADSAVVTAINTRMVGLDDFIRVGSAVALTAAGRKSFIRAYEQRIDTLVTHPLFGYRVSYRRVMEIQARLIARVLLGEITSYSGFQTR